MAAKFGQKTVRVNANGTVNVVSNSAYLSWVKMAVIDPGSGSWTITIQDRAEDPPGTPKPNPFISGKVTAGSNAGDANNLFEAPDPVLMKGGIDIVASTGTAGDVYLWFFGWQNKDEPA